MVRNSFDVQAASRSSSAYPFFLWKDVRPVLFLFLTGGFSKFKLPNTGNNYRLRDIWSKINIDNVQAILFKCSTRYTYMYVYLSTADDFLSCSLIFSVILILFKYRHIVRLFIIWLWKFNSLWIFFFFFFFCLPN